MEGTGSARFQHSGETVISRPPLSYSDHVKFPCTWNTSILIICSAGWSQPRGVGPRSIPALHALPSGSRVLESENYISQESLQQVSDSELPMGALEGGDKIGNRKKPLCSWL